MKKAFKLDSTERLAIEQKFAQAASQDRGQAEIASREIAKAIETPLRKTLLSGDIVRNVFTPMDFVGKPRIEFPLDLLTPGQERDFYAYVIPAEGRIPERRVEADYLMVPTYAIGNSIDANLRFIRDANWPVISRMMEVLEGGFVKKINDDGWQTILAAGVDRNIIINDPNAAVGQLTPRLLTLLNIFMRRNGGGNSATQNRSRVTHIYVSPEAHMDIRSWNLTEVPDEVRANIYYSADNDQDLINVFGINLVALDELGEGQDYQDYYGTTLGASMAVGDVEIAVAVDKQRDDSFVMPIARELEVFEDNMLHRRNLFGLYGNMELGFAVLDSRRVLLASL